MHQALPASSAVVDENYSQASNPDDARYRLFLNVCEMGLLDCRTTG